jgi:hypothetical protein
MKITKKYDSEIIVLYLFLNLLKPYMIRIK